MSKNPLIKKSNLPHEAALYDQIKIKDFLPAVKTILSDGKKELEKMLKSRKKADFENTVLVMEKIFNRLHSVKCILNALASTEMSPETNKVKEKIDILAIKFANDLYFDPKVFKRVKVVYQNMNDLENDQQRLTEIYYQDFVEKGAELSSAKKTRIKKIEERLVALREKFKVNLQDATNDFILVKTKEELSGLPEDALKKAREEAENRKKPEDSYVLTLQPACWVNVLTYAQDRELRKEFARAYGARAFGGKFDNRKIIEETVRLRHERANLLGFKTHADVTLKTRMAENPDNVWKMINEMLEYAKPIAEKELAELFDLAKKLDGIEELRPYDVAYYSEKLKQEKYGFDEEALKPYFELENCISGLFEIARRKYGFTFNKIDLPVWNKDVRVYEVNDDHGQYAGLFYMDLFARDTKRGGAWANFIKVPQYNGCPGLSHVGIFLNLAKLDKVFLTKRECETLFHEFGHAISELVSRPRYSSLSSFNVQWDFVELASQFEENWVNSKEGLSIFAKHHETGEVIPFDLVEKVKEAQNFQAGYIAVRQLSFATLDMWWHHKYDPSMVDDVGLFEEEAFQGTKLLRPMSDVNMSCGFAHIFSGGYSAGYYSYKWAEILEADVFSLFEENGIFHEETCQAYRDRLLGRGNERPAIEIYRDLMGRDPDMKALLRREGFIK